MVNTKHIKRYAVPRTWLIPKKTKTWAVKSSPGPHAQDSSIPLMVALRDILKIGETVIGNVYGNCPIMLVERVRVILDARIKIIPFI